MVLNPVCTNLEAYNFNNTSDLRKILRQDKHTRIEGLCSEIAFIEDVVLNNLSPITFDFWFSLTSNGYHIRKVLTNENTQLNELDYKILDGFSKAGPAAQVSVVRFDELAKTFTQVNYVTDKHDLSWDTPGMLLSKASAPIIAGEHERNQQRTDKACDYLEQRGLLKDAAIKRIFANCWLGEAVWDIDAFTMTANGQIVALEVKQKFPTQAKTFGLNDGQRNLFNFLTRLGMPVVHVILKKPENNKELHAIDLLTLPQFVERTDWLYTRFFPEKLRPAANLAPGYTSITGQSGLSYSHISEDHFALLKKFRQPTRDVRSKLFAGLE